MANCPNCGSIVENGKKFCSACGTKMPVIVHQKMCKVCGNTLSETAAFCNVCGTPVPKDAPKAEEQAVVRDENRNPTMDEVAVPILTDDAPELREKPLKNDDTPTMDSIYMPGQQPVQQPAMQAAQPMAEKAAMASRTVNVAPTPTVGATPVINDTMYNQSQQMTQNTVLTPEGQRVPANATAIPNNQGTNAYNNMPNNNFIPNNTNNNFNQPMSGVTPGKGAGALLPIILIILILGVIAFDVFYLFKDQIFGSKADTKVTCDIVTMDEEISDFTYFE